MQSWPTSSYCDLLSILLWFAFYLILICCLSYCDLFSSEQVGRPEPTWDNTELTDIILLWFAILLWIVFYLIVICFLSYCDLFYIVICFLSYCDLFSILLWFVLFRTSRATRADMGQCRVDRSDGHYHITDRSHLIVICFLSYCELLSILLWFVFFRTSRATRADMGQCRADRSDGHYHITDRRHLIVICFLSYCELFSILLWFVFFRTSRATRADMGQCRADRSNGHHYVTNWRHQW